MNPKGQCHTRLAGLLDPGDTGAERLLHLRQAAEQLPADAVYAEVMKLPEPTVVTIVQQFLKDAGRPVAVDGAIKPSNGRSIATFCLRAKITGCRP
jgi:hypothetical protein